MQPHFFRQEDLPPAESAEQYLLYPEQLHNVFTSLTADPKLRLYFQDPSNAEEIREMLLKLKDEIQESIPHDDPAFKDAKASLALTLNHLNRHCPHLEAVVKQTSNQLKPF